MERSEHRLAATKVKAAELTGRAEHLTAEAQGRFSLAIPVGVALACGAVAGALAWGRRRR